MILFLFLTQKGGIDTIWTAYILTTKVVKPADWPREDYRMTMTGVFVGKFYPNSKGDQSGRGSGFICPLLKRNHTQTQYNGVCYLYSYFFSLHTTFSDTSMGKNIGFPTWTP